MSARYPASVVSPPCTVMITDKQHLAQAEQLCQQFGLALSQTRSSEGFQLCLTASGLQLFNHDEPAQKPLMVDFVSGANAHRRQFGGGRGQTIAKAVGLKSGACPTVIDATAGLGKDAFVLASLGCRVTLVERHPVVAALLQDGLQRAYADADIGQWMRQRMLLSRCSHINQLAEQGTEQEERVDVVYLDPMYPQREKSALVKKDMRTFHSLVGSDNDASHLLPPALLLAHKRVVVKRPDYAGYLAEVKPTMQLAMKNNRFDVYVKNAIN